MHAATTTTNRERASRMVKRRAFATTERAPCVMRFHASCTARRDNMLQHNICTRLSECVVQYHMLCRIYRSIYTYTHTKY